MTLFALHGNINAAGNGKFVAPADKILLIVGQDRDAIDSYVETTGLVPGGFSVYTSIQNMDGLWDEADYGGGRQNADYLLKKYPNTVLHIGLWMVNRLDETNAGHYDQNIDRLAKWIKKLDKPVFLRVGYEFDFQPNNYDPEAYKNAFRRLVKHFRIHGVNNAAFVWHSFGGQGPRSLEDWYPGDEYVDWFAVSYFSQSRIDLDVMPKLARIHGKPFMIAEATPFGIGARQGSISWDTWFSHFFQYARDWNVKTLCYIDCNWESLPLFLNQGWGDARVQQDEFVKAKWLEEIGKPAYLNAGPGLYEILGFTPNNPKTPSVKQRVFTFVEKFFVPLTRSQ